MTLAISNIAWSADEDAEVLSWLTGQGVLGIEIAPTRIWPGWTGASPAAAAGLRDKLAEQGLHVPALQAALFDRPGLLLFGDVLTRRDLVTHLALVASLAGALGAGAIVFGAPRNRDRGTLSHGEAMRAARDTLRAIGDACAAAGTSLCLEPNPPEYGCNFLTTWQEAAEMVALVDHPGVGLHLDTACIHLAGGDAAAAIAACGADMRHFHISEPALSGFAAPHLDHARIGAALRASPYSGAFSIEMRRQTPILPALDAALSVARAHYV